MRADGRFEPGDNALPVLPRLEANIMQEPNSGCWLWMGTCGSHGYGQLSVGNYPHTAHRLAYEQWVGPIAKGLYVLHKCDTRSCCNPNHLYLGTQKQNGRDMVERGRAFLVGRYGEQTNGAKLTEVQVREILAVKNRRRMARELGRKYGVSHSTITGIWHRRTWTHLK